MRFSTRRRRLTTVLAGAVTVAVATVGLTTVAEAAVLAAPPPPTGVAAIRLTGTSVALSWKASQGATSYDVFNNDKIVTNTNIPTTFFGGLNPSTTYRITVKAKNGSETGPASAPLSVTTKSDPGGGGGNTVWAGARSSSYGINPFPNPCGFGKALTSIGAQFPGSAPTSIWIVGNLSGGGVALQFPKPAGSGNFDRISFASTDKHEAYLNFFDANDIKVWLQVESGRANMEQLIDLVLKRYGHHPSVLGFAVDVEWYNPAGPDLNDPVTNAIAQRWEAKVKSYKSSYQLVLKHFNPGSLPATYRGDIVFVDDSQGFKDEASFLAEFKGWADVFYPAKVAYQIGYATDQAWWSTLAKPVPETLGKRLAEVTRQQLGILWVDFTLRSVAPTTC